MIAKIIIVEHNAAIMIPNARREINVHGNVIFPYENRVTMRTLSQTHNNGYYQSKIGNNRANSWAAAHCAYNEPITFEGPNS